MTPHERLECALSGGRPDRTPVVPKIWIDSACSVLGKDVLESLSDPSTAMRTIIDAGIACGTDPSGCFTFRPGRSKERMMERAMFDLLEQPGLVHGAMEKGIAIALEKAKFHADLGIRFLRLNDSVANMSVISPDLWREFIFPHMRDFCTEIHRYSPGIKVYCHICGNVLPIMEDLKKTGLECIAPLDPLGGPGPAEYRAAAGEGFPLMGGVNTLSFIQKDSAEVRREAIDCIDAAGAQGAFVLGSGCALPKNTRKENLWALRDASEEYRLK
jgi:uroporphyrinogen-III decarboxylase